MRTRLLIAGAAVLGTGALLAGPISVAAQDDDDTQEDDDDSGGWVQDALDDLVAGGTLTQQQADAVEDALRDARPERPGPWGRGGPWGPGPGPFHGIARFGLDTAAEAIGIEPEALREALAEGQTVAEVAAANGVDAQVVIDALVAEVESQLDELVADGVIEEAERAEHVAEATERINEMVNEGFPFRHKLERFGDDDEDEEEEPAEDEGSTTTTTTG
jgi:hypothetical protein